MSGKIFDIQTIARQAQLEQAIELTLGPLWEPKSSPQRMAYETEADILGYGGAAGGGKTDLLLGLAFTEHRKGIIFRERFSDLVDVVSRGDEIQRNRCSFVWGEKRRWNTPDGRQLGLGAMEHQKHLKKYKGRGHDFVGFDEAVDLQEDFVRFVLGWLRTTIPGQRCRAVLTFNPPTTPEGEWIIKFFAPWLDESHPNPAEPGELRWYIRKDDEDVEVDGPEPVQIGDATFEPLSRTFIPARVEDNPYLAGTGYVNQLNSLPEPLRSQLLFGDFGVGTQDDEWQVIPTQWVLDAFARFEKQQRPDVALRAVGMDVSRGGKDNTTLAKLYGNYFDHLIVHPGEATPDGAVAAKHATDALGDENAPIWIDVIGIGASAYDHLKVMPNVQVIPVNFSEGSSETDRSGRYSFANLRSEAYWKMREALDPNSNEDICLPPLRELRVDLCAARYKIVGGKIKVECKQDIKKRIGRSPDYSDAVVNAWHGARKGSSAILFDY